MFRLDRHIEILLLKHDCVMLPGFGGFVKHHASARIDAESGTMLPPGETIGFHQHLTVNDTLIVQSYVDAYDYSFPEALSIVKEEIRQIRAVLGEEGRFVFRSVGTLTLTPDGILVFEPVSPALPNPKFYGLAPLDITREDSFASGIAVPAPAETRGGDPAADAAETENAGDGDGDDFVIRIPKRYVKRAAVACAVILLLAAIPFVGTRVGTRELVSGVNLDFICSLMPKSDTTAGPVSVAAGKETPAAEEAAAPETATPGGGAAAEKDAAGADSLAETPPEDVYTVVLAARIPERNARAFADRLKEENGIAARVTGSGKDLKVVCGEYGTMDEAQTARREIAAAGFADAWVFKCHEKSTLPQVR